MVQVIAAVMCGIAREKGPTHLYCVTEQFITEGARVERATEKRWLLFTFQINS